MGCEDEGLTGNARSQRPYHSSLVSVRMDYIYTTSTDKSGYLPRLYNGGRLKIITYLNRKKLNVGIGRIDKIRRRSNRKRKVLRVDVLNQREDMLLHPSLSQPYNMEHFF
jgi:hypothetical protein